MRLEWSDLQAFLSQMKSELREDNASTKAEIREDLREIRGEVKSYDEKVTKQFISHEKRLTVIETRVASAKWLMRAIVVAALGGLIDLLGNHIPHILKGH